MTVVDMVLDVGQSSSRARLVDNSEQIGELVDLPGFVAGTDIQTSILETVEAASRRFAALRLDRVGVGATGLFGEPPGAGWLGEELHRRHGTTLLRVSDDGVTAFLGALGGQHGASAAVGTGIVGFAWGPGGAARADGVGAMIGDNGSGWWIGRAGLIAAISSHDGRQPASAALLEAAVVRYGPLASIPQVIASATSPIGAVSWFAKDVADVARTGDPVAVAIWQEAGSHIAGCLLAVADRAGISDDLHWSLLGNIARSADLLEPTLGRALRHRYPRAHRHTPLTSPLDGVALLLRLEDITAFRPMVSESRPR